MSSLLRTRIDLRHWALQSEGSTRPLAWIRIGTMLLVWPSFAPDLSIAPGARAEWIALVLAFHLGALGFFLGLFSRVSGVLIALALHAMVYGLGASGLRPEWDHHYGRLLCSVTLLLTLVPAGRSYSLDRLRALRAARGGAPVPAERHNLWVMRLIALQVSAVYFWAAFDKSTPGFLSGARLQHIAMFLKLGSASLQGDALVQSLSVACAWATVVVEYFLAFALFLPRTRLLAAALGVAFHAVLAWVMPAVGPFSALMWLLYLAFFDADALHALSERWGAPRATT